jgi:hypothetical protein
MARKRDFAVKLAKKGKEIETFTGKGCVVKDKTILAKMEMENPYRETIDCESYSIKRKGRKKKKSK